MNKHEKTVLDLLLDEVKSHREEVKVHGKVLARLDERTEHIQLRIDGVEKRVNRRSALVATLTVGVVGPLIAFALSAFGWPRG